MSVCQVVTLWTSNVLQNLSQLSGQILPKYGERTPKTFNSLEYFSTRADLLTANYKDIVGATAPWIYLSTLKWEKAAITCRRVRERQTYDMITG